MNEPRLENIDDYYVLKGTKRVIVFTVIAILLIIGVIYAGAKQAFSEDDDQLSEVKTIPVQ